MSSLTADGGVENALDTAIKVEIEELEESQRKNKNISSSPLYRLEHENLMSEEAIREVQAKKGNELKSSQIDELDESEQVIPLLSLLKQLLKNSTATTLAQLQSFSPYPVQSTNSVGHQPSTNNSFSSSKYNNSLQSDIDTPRKESKSPSLLLLLKFQRLLFSRILSIQNQIRLGDRDNGECCIFMNT